jgi:hypothetical protein
MKKIVRNLTILGSIGGSAIAAPFLAIGDNAELFATGDASVAYNDNILLGPSSGEIEDTVFSLKPGFDLVYGKDSAVKGNLFANSTLTSYADNVKLNNQLLGFGATASYDNDRVNLNANASFNELDQATVDVVPTAGKLLERHVTALGVDGEYVLSEKFSVGSGLSYGFTDYKTPGTTEEKSYTVPVNVYYELTPKIDASTGVTYKRTELTVSGANKYDSFYYNVGARGSFTPKLSGSFSVGYNTRNAHIGADEDGSLGARASLAYAYTDKTQFSLGLNRDFSNATSGGASYENTEFSLAATSSITVDWRVNAGVTYRMLDYTGYTNDYYEGSVGTTYIINNHLSSTLSYVYRQQNSDLGAASEFSNNLVTLSISARY